MPPSLAGTSRRARSSSEHRIPSGSAGINFVRISASSGDSHFRCRELSSRSNVCLFYLAISACILNWWTHSFILFSLHMIHWCNYYQLLLLGDAGPIHLFECRSFQNISSQFLLDVSWPLEPMILAGGKYPYFGPISCNLFHHFSRSVNRPATVISSEWVTIFGPVSISLLLHTSTYFHA